MRTIDLKSNEKYKQASANSKEMVEALIIRQMHQYMESPTMDSKTINDFQKLADILLKKKKDDREEQLLIMKHNNGEQLRLSDEEIKGLLESLGEKDGQCSEPI